MRKLFILPIGSVVKMFSALGHVNEKFLAGWVKIQSPESDSALVTASLRTEHEVYNCIGTVAAKSGCWSFLKGGFTLGSPSNSSTLSFQVTIYKDVFSQGTAILFLLHHFCLFFFCFFSGGVDFKSSDSRDIAIAITSASLQPFTDQQWRRNQQDVINKVSSVLPLFEATFFMSLRI